jgi:hypothetical protein
MEIHKQVMYFYKDLPLIKDLYLSLVRGFFFLHILFLCQCTQFDDVSNVRLPESKQIKPFIYCILTPNDTIVATIRKTRNIDNNNVNFANDGISNAAIEITDLTNQSKVVLKHTLNGFYGASQKKFPIQAGRSYSLKVTIPDYSFYTSTCILPKSGAEISKLTFSPPFTEFLTVKRRIEIEWTGVSSSESLGYFIIQRYKLQNSGNSSLPVNEKSKSSDITKVDNNYIFKTITSDTKDSRDFYLCTADVNLFKFYLSSELLIEIGKQGSNDFFDAYSNIVPEYTNIEGSALGVFGGYIKTQKTVQFR